ncbi:MAG TPA: hypothetical protein VIG75_10790 [Citricoccus sp.]
MMGLLFWVWGPVLAGPVVALAWWLVRGRQRGLPPGTNRVIPLVAGVVLLLGVAAETLLGMPLFLPFDVPMEVWTWYSDTRFAIPLLLGILGLTLLAFPVRHRSGRGTAQLSPRTPVSFGRRWWFITPGVLAVLIVAITVLTGSASQPEPTTGRYAVYFVDVGEQYSMGTSIYGWFYSVPSLILLAILLATAYLDLVLIARPALGPDHDRDGQVRTVRTRNVLAVTSGALLVHLGMVLASLAGTASMRGEFTGPDGTTPAWTTFAALEPAFSGASLVACALGVGLWATVLLSAVSARHPVQVLAAS